MTSTRRFLFVAMLALVLAAALFSSSYATDLGANLALTLPEVSLATFGNIPLKKEPTLRPELPDTATTLDKAVNYQEVVKFLGLQLSDAQKRFLEDNKFLLVPGQALGQRFWSPIDPCEKPWDEMLTAYDNIGGEYRPDRRRPENARLVTPDVVLHAFHKFFENSLKYVEKKDLAVMLRAFVGKARVKALENKQSSSGKLAERYELIAAQFTVPYIILENASWEAPAPRSGVEPDETEGNAGARDSDDTLANAEKLLDKVRDGFSSETLKKIRSELALIYEAEALAGSPLFEEYSLNHPVEMDYTQFIPRSHYTDTSVTRAYFRTMMYLGRNSYFLATDAGITDALLVMHLLAGQASDGLPIMDDWRKIMEITSFYAGRPDDICYPELRDFVVKVLGTDEFNPKAATDPAVVNRLSERLNELHPPRILSDPVGIGGAAESTKEQRLERGKAFRIFGQRFTIDGWILGRLTAGLEKTDVRLPSTPSALFVPAVFGDKAARESTAGFLKAVDPPFSDRDVGNFFGKLDAVAADVKRLEDREWFGSLNFAWLNVLGNLTGSFGEGYPLYMQSPLFPVKQLETFLGSYTELKHDLILYEKPPLAECGDGQEEEKVPPVPKGFVEPNVRFWYALQRLIQYAHDGFTKHRLMERERQKYGGLGRFKEQVDFYTRLAEKEVLGIAITDEEYERLRTGYLEYMAVPFEPAEAPLDEKDRRSGLVVDIHTDLVKGQILYEATGRPYVMLALVGNEASPRLVIGLAFNHYEFAGPLGTRLTDAEWQKKAYDDPKELPPKNYWYKGVIVK